MEKIFITKVDDQKVLAKIKFTSQTTVECEFLYPLDRVKFEYDSETISLNTLNNYSEVKFLIHSVYRIYDFLIQSKEGILKNYNHLRRYREGKDVSKEKLPKQVELAGQIIERIEEFTESKYVNKYLKERISKHIVSVLNDYEFDFEIFEWSDYDWVFYKTVKEADFIMNLDSYETIKKTVYWLERLRKSWIFGNTRFKIIKDEKLNSELPKEEIDKLEYKKYRVVERKRLPVFVDVHNCKSRTFALERFTDMWEDSQVAIIDRETENSNDKGMGIYWVMRGGKLMLIEYFKNEKSKEKKAWL